MSMKNWFYFFVTETMCGNSMNWVYREEEAAEFSPIQRTITMQWVDLIGRIADIAAVLDVAKDLSAEECKEFANRLLLISWEQPGWATLGKSLGIWKTENDRKLV